MYVCMYGVTFIVENEEKEKESLQSDEEAEEVSCIFVILLLLTYRNIWISIIHKKTEDLVKYMLV